MITSIRQRMVMCNQDQRCPVFPVKVKHEINDALPCLLIQVSGKTVEILDYDRLEDLAEKCKEG